MPDVAQDQKADHNPAVRKDHQGLDAGVGGGGCQPLLDTLNAQDQGLGAFSRVQERGGGQEVAGTSERHGHLILP